MDQIELSLECGSRTCKTRLGNPSQFPVVEDGAVNSFSGIEIGNCDKFQCNQELNATLTHASTDGWNLEDIT